MTSPSGEQTTTIVIFGASGDLTLRKLIPSLCGLFCKGRLGPEVRIVGMARSNLTTREYRDEIRNEVMETGFSAQRQVFVQCYGNNNLDAANLMLPVVGFIPATDPKMKSTIRAIQAGLTSEQGFVYRYTDFDDRLGGTEGSFTICTFWLADNLIQLGEMDEARKLFDAAMGCANDLGLLSEEFDTNADRA